MPQFIAIGYGDAAGYDGTAPELRRQAHDHDASLHKGGATMGVAGEPVQVRNTDARGAQRTRGAYMSSELPVAGFTILEATNLEHALDLFADTPCAVAQGVVEVWPLHE